MKKFIVTVLGAAVLSLGLGALVESVGARFKSDQKALELIAKARQALGGDAAIKNVQSMRIVGMTSQSSKTNGVDSLAQGETEIAFQLPDKMMRTVRFGKGDGSGAHDAIVNSEVNVVVASPHREKVVALGGDSTWVEGTGSGEVKKFVFKNENGAIHELSGDEAKRVVTVRGAGEGGENERVFVIRKSDGSVEQLTGVEAEKMLKATREADRTSFSWKEGNGTGKAEHVAVLENAPGGMAFKHSGSRDNEMLRLTLSLLMTSPEGMDVSYTFGGESMVDGTACNIVVAEAAGSSYKIYLSQSTDLPVMLAYQGARRPVMVRFTKETPEAEASAAATGARVFQRTGAPTPEAADFTVKFSDYRTVDGIQLPFRWTQSVAGVVDETFDVTSFELNPANISEKFQNQRVLVRTKKADGN